MTRCVTTMTSSKVATLSTPGSQRYGDPKESTNVLRRLNFNRSQDVDWHYHNHHQWGFKELTDDDLQPQALRIPFKAQEQHIPEKGASSLPPRALPVGSQHRQTTGSLRRQVSLSSIKLLKGRADQKTVADIPPGPPQVEGQEGGTDHKEPFLAAMWTLSLNPPVSTSTCPIHLFDNPCRPRLHLLS